MILRSYTIKKLLLRATHFYRRRTCRARHIIQRSGRGFEVYTMLLQVSLCVPRGFCPALIRVAVCLR